MSRRRTSPPGAVEGSWMATIPPCAAQSSLSKWTNIASWALSCCMGWPSVSSAAPEPAPQVAGDQEPHEAGGDLAPARGVRGPEQFGLRREAGLGHRLRAAVLAHAGGAARARADARLLPGRGRGR